MQKHTRSLGAAIALSGALLVGACGGDAKNDTTLGADSALARDLALAGRDTAAQPQLQDVPANPPATTTPPRTQPTTTQPRPAAQTPARQPSTPAPAPAARPTVGTIAAGTSLALRSTSKVCTNTNAEGDEVTATLTEAVTGSNGAVIPAGATVKLTLTKAAGSRNANERVVMEFRVNSISYGGNTYMVDAQVASADVARVRTTTRTEDATKVAAGAAVGAIAGQVLGRNTKSTVVGAAAGAAAGAGVAAATADFHGCLEEGNAIVVSLNSGLEVKL